MELHIKKHPESPASVTSTITDSDISSMAIASPIEPDVEISQSGGGNNSSNLDPATILDLPDIAVDDKENLKTEETYSDSTSNAYTVQRDFGYYLYSDNREQQYSQPIVTSPSNTVEPVVFADIDEKRFQASVVVSAPMEPMTHHVFFYPEPAYASFGLTNDSVHLDTTDCSSLLNLPGNDARRRVEAALEAVEEERQRQEYGARIVKIDRDPLLTPPCSNPESPASSPDLALDLVIPPRETLILPPRKRSKMILQSMESEYRNSGGSGDSLITASQRQNSVIQFARAS